ncbi:flavin reductase family protein [Bacillus sp. ISL-35]|uniref:flavin reductase family protein n=1 Tax=Bacillus sp. ISL-35 TaxID=2819122 RepID=UPI001BE6E22E|nr:flavin reductase family protein [Bacillus sp. ISL-35]MBT2679551.1 flavin reductase family protein [Bacillus sp. ISL-35]MBT2703454.1 flavin reductase family protein [Chryseobacterium sp. ISL-80]
MIQRVNQTVMHSYPGMVALVTVSHEGEKNIMAAGWHTYISYDPPIYGVAIGRERHTYQLVKEAGTFAINFVPFENAAIIQQVGVYSGSEIDKFEKANILFEQGLSTNSPILSDAYIAYECEIIDRNSYGDHDLFVANIVEFYKDQDQFLENGLPNLKKLSIPLYLGRSQYTSVNDKSELIAHKVEE